MSHRLIFDLGTTNFKASLFDPVGNTVGLSSRQTPLKTPLPGRVEIEPAVFRDTIVSLCEDLRTRWPAAYADVKSVSFATQANSFLLLDPHDQPLTPIVVWLDKRAADSPVPDINDYAATGIPSLAPQFAPAKLAWIARHQPDLWSRATRLCFLSDYLTCWWTGRHVTAAGAAGLSGLLDIHRLAWRDQALQALGMTHLSLPEPVRAGSAAHAVLPSICKQFGLPTSCRFVVGCLDQYAAAYAGDLLDRAGVCETTGTVLATVCVSRRFDPALAGQGVFQGPGCMQGVYLRMLYGSTSANLLERFRSTHAKDQSWEQLDAAAAAVYDTPSISTRSDMAMGHDVLDIYRRVAHALREQLDVLHPARPIPRLMSLGGGARSETWRRVKAEIIGQALHVLPTAEPTSYGVCRLLDATQGD